MNCRIIIAREELKSIRHQAQTLVADSVNLDDEVNWPQMPIANRIQFVKDSRWLAYTLTRLLDQAINEQAE